VHLTQHARRAPADRQGRHAPRAVRGVLYRGKDGILDPQAVAERLDDPLEIVEIHLIRGVGQPGAPLAGAGQGDAQSARLLGQHPLAR